jgi:hypothetical protein
MIIDARDFEFENPIDKGYSMCEINYYTWISPAFIKMGIRNHRLSLRKNLKDGVFEVVRHYIGAYGWTEKDDVVFFSKSLTEAGKFAEWETARFHIVRGADEYVEGAGNPEGPIEKLGKVLQYVANSEVSYSMLPEGTWLAGGCGIFARAIQKVAKKAYGVEPMLYALRSGKYHVIHHIVARIGNYYYDADGMSTAGELLSRWEHKEMVDDPLLVPLVSWPGDIQRNESASEFIAGLILSRLSG